MTESGHKLHLDRTSFVPLYVQIYRALAEQIRLGRLAAGDLVPSERELSDEYEVSRMTVRQALRSLRQDGLVYQDRGVGTFVARSKVNIHTRHLVGFTEDMRQRGLQPSSQLIGLQKELAKTPIAEALGLPPRAEVFRLERLRLADGEPMAYEVNHLPAALCPELEDYDLADNALYQILETRYGIRLERAAEALEAVSATRRAARFLAVKTGSPLLAVTRTVYAEDDRIIEYAQSLYRADRYRAVFLLTKNNL
jgi:GntR family transcriptional regulator